MRTKMRLMVLLVVALLLLAYVSLAVDKNQLTDENRVLIINEVIADNHSLYFDSNGNSYDLIEIFNAGDKDINLKGYGLTDDPMRPHKWQFPETVIEAGEYLLVSASGGRETDGLYTGFKLDKTGEKVLLSDSSGEFISSLAYQEAKPDMSYGFDGKQYSYFLKGSPGAANTGISVRNIEWYLNLQDLEPEVSLKGGIYDSPQTIEFKKASGFDIRYTLDSSIPDENSSLYDEMISIDYTDDLPIRIANIPSTFRWNPVVTNEELNAGQVIRAQYFYGDIPVGKVITNTYFIWEEGPDRYSFDVVSLTSDADNLFSGDDGIMVVGDKYLAIAPEKPNALTPANYNLKGRAWEREAHLELFDENGELSLKQNIGIRVSGAYTRTLPKKSLRIIARDEYDENQLSLGLFDVMRDEVNPEDSIDSLIIRTGGQDWNETMFRDILTGDIMNPELSAAGYKPVIMFLNGEYYGVYNLREDMNKEFVENHYHLDEDDFTMIEDVYNDIFSLDDDEEELQRYVDFFEFLRKADMTDESNYEYVESMMDIDNYLDYLVVNIFIRNADFYDNNIMIWRYTREPESGLKDGRYRYIIHDTDMGYDYYEESHYQFNSFEFLETRFDYFFENLMTSDKFKSKFVNRLTKSMNTNLSRANVYDDIKYFEDLYSEEAEENAVRWHMTTYDEDIVIAEWYDYKVGVVRNFIDKRHESVLSTLEDRYDLEDHVRIKVINNSGVPLVVDDDYDIGVYSELVHYPEFKKDSLKLEFQETETSKFAYWYFDGLSEAEISDILLDGTTASTAIEIKTDESLTIEAVFVKTDR